MRLIIVTGLSGSGKSVALHTLEDIGYYCIDNLPIALLEAFAEQLSGNSGLHTENAAVGIDARNHKDDLNKFTDILEKLRGMDLKTEILFLTADDTTLHKRYSETRRRHPLRDHELSLTDAIQAEKELLEPFWENADISIDTSRTNVHQLRQLVSERIAGSKPRYLSLMFQSFGFKNGVPSDSDFVFDVRCLPNPHWEPELRPLTGLDTQVINYLNSQALVGKMFTSISGFIESWLPPFLEDNRSYLSVAIGCTGGQHRSVYLAEQLCNHFKHSYDNVLVRHRELL